MDPIFLIGVPRSGSTMLRMILNSHPNIYSGGEMPWLSGNYGVRGFGTETSIRCLYQRMTVGDYSISKTMSHINKDNVRRSFNSFVKDIIDLQLTKEGKNIWIEKTPDNIIQIPFLKEIFPNARFIHIMRDGRDVALSTIKANWSELFYFIDVKNKRRFVNLRGLFNKRVLYRLPKYIQDVLLRVNLEPSYNSMSQNIFYPIANTYYNAFFRWEKWIEIYERDAEKYNIDHISIKYEDLLLKPKDMFPYILNFIGEDWHDDYLNYSKFKQDFPLEDIGATSALKFSSIEPRNLYKWKTNLNSRQKRITKKYFDDFLQLKGYEPTT